MMQPAKGADPGLERISPLQVAYLLVTMRGVILLALLPVVSGTSGGHDAWLSVLLGTVLGLILAWLACRVVALLPGKDLVQICEACLGKVLGKAVGILYFGFFAINAAVVLRQFSDFLTTAPMPETPTELFLGLMALATAYAILQGIEVIARVNEVTLPPLLLFIMLVLLLGLRDMDLGRLKPILAEGWVPVVRGGLIPGSLWAEVIIVAMLAPHMKNPNELFRYTVGAMMFGNLWLLLSATAVVTFFSAPQAIIQMFPIYSLMRDVSVADFLERLDPLFIIAWATASFIKLAVLSYVSSRMLARILGLADSRCLVLPLAFLGPVVALLQFDSVVDLRGFNSPDVLPLVVFPFGVLLPLLLLVTGRLRGLGRKAR